MNYLLPLGLASIFLLSTFVQSAGAVEIIAHRGASHDAPENTLTSFRMGWQHQADVVELDIHLSKDGKIVAMHDATTKRTGGVDLKVAEQTLEELKRLDVGRWKDGGFAGETIPTLDEVLATIPADLNKRLFIEIKCGPEIIPELKASLERSGKPAQQCVIICGSYDTLRATKLALPQNEMIFVGKFTQDKATQEWKPSASELIGQMKEAGFHGVDFKDQDPLNTDFIQQIKAAGLKCYAWTVDSPIKARQLLAGGIDGITTNRALWLRQQIEIETPTADAPVVEKP
ncbi:glycerophosphodiester phosphodiesterase [bacterium]|nr:MAG: glycerophosphodiester phosphodiesterase [bacterium]